MLALKYTDKNKIAKKLRNPNLMVVPIDTVFARVNKVGKAEMKERISGGTGNAEKTIRGSYNKRAGILRIGTIMDLRQAESIEEGRRLGASVSTTPLTRWLLAVGRRERRMRAAAFAVREEIMGSGTEGKRFIAGTKEYIEEHLPRYLDEAATKLKKQIEK